MNIAEFLLARVMEEHDAALAATEGPWRHNPSKVWYADRAKLMAARAGNPFVTGGEEFVGAGPDDGDNETTIGIATTGPADDPQAMADAAHIALHHPARVIRECEVKLRIVKEIMGMHDLALMDPYAHASMHMWLNGFIIPMADAYRDHPDFDEVWG